MQIEIEDLQFQTIIGILDFERVTPQNLIINLTIDYQYIDEFINYADVVNFIKEHVKKGEFLLIEDALNSLSSKLKEKFPLIKTLFLKITKPSILPDCKVSVSDTFEF
jgi:7,8-dihydroneopterin aldolase/epimerase/oxygenase